MNFSFLEDEKHNTHSSFSLCCADNKTLRVKRVHLQCLRPIYRLKRLQTRTVVLKHYCSSEPSRKVSTQIAGPHLQKFDRAKWGPRIYITNSQAVLMIHVWGPHVKNHWTRGKVKKHRLLRFKFQVTFLSSVTLGTFLNLFALEFLHQ